ncbi:MAG: hypothetical protein AAGA38_07835 [Pseudomonadota bacterium]
MKNPAVMARMESPKQKEQTAGRFVKMCKTPDQRSLAASGLAVNSSTRSEIERSFWANFLASLIAKGQTLGFVSPKQRYASAQGFVRSENAHDLESANETIAAALVDKIRQANAWNAFNASKLNSTD